MATTKETVETGRAVTVQELDIQRVIIPIRGLSPLIVHRWDDKARRAILDGQTGAPSKGKTMKDPEADYRASLYFLDKEETRYGFPSIGFKMAAIEAYKYVDLRKSYLLGTFHVDGELVEIHGTPRMREDLVRLHGRMGTTTDIRYRAEFPTWSAELPISYNARAITPGQLVNLFQHAGFGIGIGEWRPEKRGQSGRFDVGRADDGLSSNGNR